ncbi:YegP family protein [Pseudoxanthomonas sp. PXM02]|uniref:YegP family protein n=1 Tax=Pseudoxanthomonas sp. PXM02 TaxID=2769294 RepID=UPI00177FBEEC|nr:YegP family protein [Pseudoxanthomonas sp. PXM02]MBD9479856.1 YegP family protein [Pseudoxanthomonas sp. PXM02]
MAARYVLSRSGTQFRFVLKAGNNETILTSELYTTKAGAQGGIQSVKNNSPYDERYERKNASNGSPMFNLKAANGERIGTSETYSTTAAREGGIASVKVNGPTAPVDDQT